MSRETFKNLLALYKLLVQLNDVEFVQGPIDFSDEIETLEEVITEVEKTIV